MALMYNESSTRSLIGEEVLKLLATGASDDLPTKILIEVKNNTKDSFSSIGSGQGKFALPGHSEFDYGQADLIYNVVVGDEYFGLDNGESGTYAEGDEINIPYIVVEGDGYIGEDWSGTYAVGDEINIPYRYDYKIAEGDVLSITHSIENNKLKVIFSPEIGGGITQQDWWQTNCTYVSIVRIDLLSETNKTLARHEFTEEKVFPYSASIKFDWEIEIDPDELLDGTTSIDDQWLYDLGTVISGSGELSQSNLKADTVVYFDSDHSQVLGVYSQDPIESSIEMVPITHEIYSYQAELEKVIPNKEPAYFNIITDINRIVYTNNLTWTPFWLTGDAIEFTYSV